NASGEAADLTNSARFTFSSAMLLPYPCPGLGHDARRRGLRGKLRRWSLLLLLNGSAVERDVQDGVHMVGGHEFQPLADALVYLIQSRLVLGGDDDRRDPGAQGGHGLFLQSADGQDAPAQGYLARHCQIAAHRDARQRRNYSDADGYARRG